MARRIILLCSAFLLIVFNASSQGTFNFPNDKHDFGTVEEDGPISYEFQFTNTGNAPIIISDVRASCGCTTPSWPKEPIAPGGKGVIKAEYNTTGRIGIFNKTITITSNATEGTKMLQIKGIVDAKVTDKPVYTADQLKKSPLLLTSAKSACGCITYKLDKETILPGKSGILEVTYSPSMDGKNNDILTLITNDLNVPKTQVTLEAEVVESLTNQTPLKEDKTNVPFGK